MDYKAIITNVGATKISAAVTQGTEVSFLNFAVGDGSGSEYVPSPTQTALKHEVWRGGISTLAPLTADPTILEITTAIPANVGGFYIREYGIFDSAGDMIAIGNTPTISKSASLDTFSNDLAIKVYLKVNAEEAVTLDASSIAVASRADMVNLESRVNATMDDVVDETERMTQEAVDTIMRRDSYTKGETDALIDAVHAVPDGGTSGNILIKGNNNTESWQAYPSYTKGESDNLLAAKITAPTTGSAGQHLAKTATGAEWVTPTDAYSKTEIDSKVTTLNTAINKKITAPTSGSTGQHLAKTASGVQWVTPTNAYTKTEIDNKVTTLNRSIDAKITAPDEAGVFGEVLAVDRDGVKWLNLETITDMTKIYGFHIDGNESDPYEKVTYIRDAVGMTPAHMDYERDVFNYGSWKDAFFFSKPCMVKQTGEVDYYLDPDDFTKKIDGTASDVANVSYAGNAMMEWGRGGKKIWYKIVPDALDDTSADVFIADRQVDEDYHAWSFINNQNEYVDHFYTAIYNGSAPGDTMRSISGASALRGIKMVEEVQWAEMNNKSEDKLWYVETYADRSLINFLLILMGKSTDTQSVFGNGLTKGGESAFNSYVTGSLNNKGLFYGTNDYSHGVKVFGMENYWGAQSRRIAGVFLKRLSSGAKPNLMYKMTYGTADGSQASGYNLTAVGYLQGPSYNNDVGAYVDRMTFTSMGMYAKSFDGSGTTYYCDYRGFALWGSNGPYPGLFGGNSNGDEYGNYAQCGALYECYMGPVTEKDWATGSALSFKPRA